MQALEIRPLPMDRDTALGLLAQKFGFKVIESDPKGNSRPLKPDELAVLYDTVAALGPMWYGGFLARPINFWIDKNPGGGGYNDGWIRIGEPGDDPSILYRILIHEGTHATNEYRKWMYETEWCTRPGLDWRKVGDGWQHPRIQGDPAQQRSGEWETLPTSTRDVSINPGEDLAETVRYFVHSVKAERAYLWPLDLSKPAIYLWDSSPTRYVFVRDVFLKLTPDHPWYKTLHPTLERYAKANLGI
jgi:hypothetical protein